METAFRLFVEEAFGSYPKGKIVALALLEKGVSIKDNHLFMNGFKLPISSVAEKLGVDPRTVNKVIKDVAKNPKLNALFRRLTVHLDLSCVARYFHLSVLELKVEDASKPDILGRTATIFGRNNVPIRACQAQDYTVWPQPSLKLVTEGQITGTIFEQLQGLSGITSVKLYRPVDALEPGAQA